MDLRQLGQWLLDVLEDLEAGDVPAPVAGGGEEETPSGAEVEEPSGGVACSAMRSRVAA